MQNNNNTEPYSDHYDDDFSEDQIPLLTTTMKMDIEEYDDHCHVTERDRDSSRQASKRLSVACVLCFLFVIGELMGGYYSGSLAIMTDAAHMFADFASFGISLFAIWMSGKRPRKSMTYGYYRAEAMGALATVVIIWYVTGILVYLAIERLKSGSFEIHDTAMVAVASAAVLFNITLGLVLHGVVCSNVTGFHGHSHGGGHGHLVEEGEADVHSHSHGGEKHLNVRAALIHVLGDLLQSVGVLFSSVLIKIFGDSCKIVDPVCTLVFACIVLVTTLSVLKDSVRILVEGAPKNINFDKVREELTNIPNVCAVHDLHLWSLTADRPTATVHLAVSADADQSKILQEARNVLRTKYHIQKTTIQVEIYQSQICDNCEQCKPLLS